jgi:hypothetical protein
MTSTLFGTARFEHHVGLRTTTTDRPEEREELSITVPAALKAKAVSAAVRVSVFDLGGLFHSDASTPC